jgi:hypothetical protein
VKHCPLACKVVLREKCHKLSDMGKAFYPEFEIQYVAWDNFEDIVDRRGTLHDRKLGSPE